MEMESSRDSRNSLLEAAPDAMVCVDSSGRIVLVNAQAERLFGYRREELAGQPAEILVPDAVKAGHPKLRAGYMADPEPRPMGAGIELSGRRRDGSTFPAEISLSAIDTDEGILVSAAVRDVTDRQRQQDEVKRGYRNLESFAYSVAHDLRTPLRALAGFSAALLDDCGDSLGEVGRGYAERIEAASLHMSALIDSISHLSHVSRAELNLQAVDLGAEAASLAQELHHESAGRRVRFIIQQPAWARSDRVLTVLQNLLGNAWKFTSCQDDPTIEFGTIPGAGAHVCCYVRDNGAGFDPAYTGKLFQPFQRLHTTREFAGIGVGLASVRQIVERHGGRAWAEGAVGKGATFYFTLPAKEAT
jgi:PAS domain S-box-containing protein